MHNISNTKTGRYGQGAGGAGGAASSGSGLNASKTPQGPPQLGGHGIQQTNPTIILDPNTKTGRYGQGAGGASASQVGPNISEVSTRPDGVLTNFYQPLTQNTYNPETHIESNGRVYQRLKKGDFVYDPKGDKATNNAEEPFTGYPLKRGGFVYESNDPAPQETAP